MTSFFKSDKQSKPISFQSKLLWSYILILTVPVLSALLLYGVNLYYQTRSNYENVLRQLNSRTNVILSDFVSTVSRNTFFYLTDTKLQAIMNKNESQTGKEYLDDYLYVQHAMDQFVLMNGNISAITLLAPNGMIYNSTNARVPDIGQVSALFGDRETVGGKILVSAPYKSSTVKNEDQFVSALRTLTDLNADRKSNSFIKVDINFKSIINILGSASDRSSSRFYEPGTIVVAGDQVIYHSHEAGDNRDYRQMTGIAALLERDANSAGISMKADLGRGEQRYMFSMVVNEQTNWKIIQYIPAQVIDRSFLVNTGNYMLLSLACLLAAFLLSVWMTKRFIRPINKLNRAIKLVDSDNWDLVTLETKRNDEIGRLIGSYKDMIARLKESREKELLSGQLQKRAELNMMQAQINPHFLYNTLNTIHSIAELQGSEEIAAVSRSLSSMYRYNIKAGDMVEIGQELEQIRNYITIQQIRFFGKFEVRYSISEELYPYKILKFLLQPLVENSFYHGLEPKGGRGLLMLSMELKGQFVEIRIEDDGVGMDNDKLEELNGMFAEPGAPQTDNPSPHLGLQNIHGRIKHYYGPEYWIRASQRPEGGTCIEMAIPAVKGDGMR
ncbi:MAG: carotenoid epsilon cyclase [Paenibacillus sp.]|uniref:sensor histidine kinase n=1 Tax=Paenibacillus sp. GCM10012303 TaxID=3317340 RepID=UPI0029F183C9|nr:carotenoid epsilon cyclase [Paenibacillus sp.]